MTAIKGRGVADNPANRFAPQTIEYDDEYLPGDQPTEYIVERSRSIIATNQSPDVPFNQSVNAYRGCEHGCVYCFARPTHAYLDMSPGLDFESKIVYKPDAAMLLEKALSKRAYVCQVLAMGTNTDPYQQAEKRFGITRSILEVLQRTRHPLSIVTKSSLIERDIDILAEMAQDGLVSVGISVTSLDRDLKRLLEPRTASGQRRLKTIEALAARAVPVSVLVAPLIPAINDSELESILAASANAGAQRAAYIFLRLPGEVEDLFDRWLSQHFPERRRHVMSLVAQSRNGFHTDPRFHRRMRGEGVFANLVARRFETACRRYGLRVGEGFEHNTRAFRKPVEGGQLTLL